jgi:sugar phosphate isomerase/epimerase
MLKIGRSIRWYNDFNKEIEFSKSNGFDFMQIWYQKGKILVDTLDEPKALKLKECNFPIIIHAVFQIDDFAEYGDKLIQLVKYLKHTEVIIHPVCEEREINSETIYELADNIHIIADKLENAGIVLYIENNSVIDTINYKPSDLEIIFNRNQNVELLLDIAHIDNYEHLGEIIAVKYPKCLHIADKHFHVKHEHLPVGMGDLDYNLIFSKFIKDFEGRIILEIVAEDELVLNSKEKILKAINNYK